ncbi:hypothetical protein JHK85_036628 [Glycine max]|nr:hypothetical protein JHK85_036628 [Glycine max]
MANWKPLKALCLTRNKRFNCSFSVQVHLIEGLPLSFNDFSLCVHWKRRGALLVTPPAKVIQGVAEFQDILTRNCSIHGSRSGPHNSAKYEAKHFMLLLSLVPQDLIWGSTGWISQGCSLSHWKSLNRRKTLGNGLQVLYYQELQGVQ